MYWVEDGACTLYACTGLRVVHVHCIHVLGCTVEYSVSCKASTMAFPDNASLNNEFLVRLPVSLGPTLEMLL